MGGLFALMLSHLLPMPFVEINATEKGNFEYLVVKHFICSIKSLKHSWLMAQLILIISLVTWQFGSSIVRM